MPFIIYAFLKNAVQGKKIYKVSNKNVFSLLTGFNLVKKTTGLPSKKDARNAGFSCG